MCRVDGYGFDSASENFTKNASSESPDATTRQRRTRKNATELRLVVTSYKVRKSQKIAIFLFKKQTVIVRILDSDWLNLNYLVMSFQNWT